MLDIIDLRAEPERLRDAVRRRTASLDEARSVAREIIADVRVRGDAAVCSLTLRYDGAEVTPETLRVGSEELADAWRGLSPELKMALQLAAERVRSWNEVPDETRLWVEDGIEVSELHVPVHRVGVYVPGGRAEYPSTVLMTVIPARCAGVEEVVLCVPPGRDGAIPATTAAAAHLAGVDEVYRIGGAQAIAALAHGTATIAPVDMIVGPGNAYVAMAKLEVSGVVGVESVAGPSECVVVADHGANPDVVAWDLIAQAEHGPGGFVLLVTWSDALASRVAARVEECTSESPRADEIRSTLGGGRIVLCRDAEHALDVVNAAAAEHVQLAVADPSVLVPGIRNAGAVFAGYATPVTLGDYVAGPSHVLPTGGTARFASALSPADFVRSIHLVEGTRQGLEGPAGRAAATLAAAEGLSAHARAVTVRVEAGDDG